MNRRLTAALVFLVTVVAMEAMSVAPVLPVIKAELGGLAWYGWAFAAFSLAQILAIPLTGRWVDRTNPAVPLAGGIGSFVAGLVVASAAQSMPMLIGGRVLQGFGAGVIPAVAYVCVGRGFTEAERPRVFALMSTAWIVPSVVGPTAASFVTGHVGWRWVFGGLVPITVVAGAFAVGVVRSLGGGQGAGRESSAGATGALVLVAGTVGLVAGSQQSRPAVAVPLTLVGLVVAGLAFTRLTPKGTLAAAPGLPAAVAVRGLLTCAFFAADAFVPLTMQEVRGTGPQYAGFVFTVAAFTWTAGSWTQARLAGRVGPRAFVRCGLALVATGAGLLLALASTGVPTWIAVVAWGIGGLGIGLAYSPLSLVTLARAEPGREGFATSALQLSDALGIAVGTGLGGAVVTTAERWGRGVDAGVIVVFAAAAVLAAASVLVAQRVPARVSDVAVDTAAAA